MKKRYFVAGCGGLGCYIVENLMRMGVSEITVCDGDEFSESNLNRQLYATPATLGTKKVIAASNRANELKFAGTLIAIPEFITKDNVLSLLDDIDIVIDALDNTESRFILEDACKDLNLPLVHGAVGEWNYQVAISMPGSNLLHDLYQNKEIKNEFSTFSFTVEACAAVQTAEALKIANGEKTELENSLLLVDLKNNCSDIIKL